MLASNPEQARQAALALEAETLRAPRSAGNAETVRITRWLRAEALIQLAQFEPAGRIVEAELRAFPPAQRNTKVHADLLMARASLGTIKGNASQALADSQSAFQIYGTLGNRASQARALQFIGLIYQNAGDFQRVLKYYGQAGELSSDPVLDLGSSNNQGDALAALGRYDEAERFYTRALRSARGLGNELLEALILDNIARTQIRAHKFGRARATLAAGLALTRKPAALEWRPLMLGTAASLALNEGRLDAASRLLKEAVPVIGAANTLQSYRDLHLTGYQTFKRLGDDNRSLAHFEAFTDLEREGRELSSSVNASLSSARFDFATQNSRIATLKAGQLSRDIALERLRARQAAVVLGALLAIVTLIALALTLYLRALRRNGDAIQQMNASLAESNTKLEAALRAKSEFLATTSHEIRTPLNGVLGMTQVLLDDNSLNAEARERLNLLHGAGIAMRVLVDDLLQLAKLDVGNRIAVTEDVDLHRFLRDVIAFWEDAATRKNLYIELDLGDAPQWIVGDPVIYRQILTNLLSNALKFTSKGGVRVAVQVSTLGVDERLTISVADTGIGIPAGSLESIFEKFQQVDSSTTRQFGGTGLGLAIARELTSALGGELRVESVLGTGSIFTMSVMLLRSSHAAEAIGDHPVSSDELAICLIGFKPIARTILDNVLAPQFARRTSADSFSTLGRLAESIDVAIIESSTLLDADPATLRAGVETLHHNGVQSIVFCTSDSFETLRDLLGSVLVDRDQAGDRQGAPRTHRNSPCDTDRHAARGFSMLRPVMRCFSSISEGG